MNELKFSNVIDFLDKEAVETILSDESLKDFIEGGSDQEHLKIIFDSAFKDAVLDVSKKSLVIFLLYKASILKLALYNITSFIYTHGLGCVIVFAAVSLLGTTSATQKSDYAGEAAAPSIIPFVVPEANTSGLTIHLRKNVVVHLRCGGHDRRIGKTCSKSTN